MHELALMGGLVETVVEQIGDRRVAAVAVEIGELAGISVDALRFCFELCANETPLAQAALEIRSIAGAGRCNSCGIEAAMPSFCAPCACGSFDRAITRGTELRLAYVEVL
jgi:hydrogenase nickel incorporation protein HypA/HybF